MENQGRTVYNFSAGPCCLPKEVLKQAQDNCISWHGTGISPMEMSHRSKAFVQISEQAEKDFRDMMSVPKNYKVFFFQGGATMQFSAIAYNLLKENTKANYITTGSWSQQAFAEAKKIGNPVEAWPESGRKFDTIPEPSTWKIEKDAAYFHYCDNETVHGVEFKEFPYEMIGGMTLVCDMSSNMCSRPVDWEKYGVVYAGAQKNIGPAGATIVVVREDLIGHQRPDTPVMFDWKVFRDATNQYHNTPATWPIYVCGLNIAHMKKNGIQYYAEQAKKKSSMLYDYIDSTEGYYTNNVDPNYRSRMNVVFRVKKDDKLEDKFVKEAAE